MISTEDEDEDRDETEATLATNAPPLDEELVRAEVPVITVTSEVDEARELARDEEDADERAALETEVVSGNFCRTACAAAVSARVQSTIPLSIPAKRLRYFMIELRSG